MDNEHLSAILEQGMTLDELQRLVTETNAPLEYIVETAYRRLQSGEPLMDEADEASTEAPTFALSTISAADLQRAELPPVKFIVEKLIAQGLTLIASPPKFGKSWLVLFLCLCVAAGHAFLGFKVNMCNVLYLALEDSKHRLKARMESLLSGQKAPLGFDFAIQSHTLGDGLLEELDGYLRQNPNTGLVVVDTLQKVRGPMHGREGAYAVDYREMAELKGFADTHGIALVLVHHLRKMGDDGDPFARISGTNGVFGAADTAIVLTRDKRSDTNTTANIVGRDVESAELVLQFQPQTGEWINLGDADDVAEREAKKQYQSSPLILTIKKLVDQAPGGWQGTAQEILSAGQYITRTSLAVSARELTGQIKAYESLLLEIDGIVHERKSNGSGGGKHRFYKLSDAVDEFEDGTL